MRKIAILGASGHGKVVADLAELLGYSVLFFDRAWPECARNARWPVEGDGEILLGRLDEFDGVVVAIGDNRVRQQRQTELAVAGATLSTLIHPSAQVSRYAALGRGVVVFANAVVNVDCNIGEGVIINTGATVDHDGELGDFAHISPGAHLAGNVQVGERTWVGIGAVVRQGAVIGDDVIVGAGAVVVSNVPSRVCVTGVPARPVIRR